MITSIIFSKDRALQLDLAINSIKKNMPCIDKINVIMKCSNEQFTQAYKQVKFDHPDVNFIDQSKSLFNDVLQLSNIEGYVVFFTDDDIVFRRSQTTVDDINQIMSDKTVCCISFRVGVNTTKRDYGNGVLQPDHIPSIARFKDSHIMWNRFGTPVGGYWTYPLSVDGHLFRSNDMERILSTIYNWPESKSCAQTPNMLEAYMQRFFFEIPVHMYSEKVSCVVNSPNNRVQEEYENRFGDSFNYSAESLNDLYLQGKRLRIELLDDIVVNCPHQELELLNAIR